MSWLGVRDWLAANYNAEFLNAFVDPITLFWSVEVQTLKHPHGSLLLCLSDFPDDLILRAQDAASEWLIHDTATRLRTERPDLGDLRAMDRGSFKQWIDPLRKTAK
ncbi:MAG: hypothetical protein JNK16_05660 [Phycisphaerales bacterium]|nr:hypothetical protein [Phycisphaerales bacterium]